MSSANWPELAPEPDAQLKAYELGLKETDQIIAIQNHTATVATTLLVVTGAIWAALHAKEVRIPDSAAVAILALHILACLPALQLLVSNTNAINLRFAFHKHYSRLWFPDIEALGGKAFGDVYKSTDSMKGKYFRWGRCQLLWYFIPVAGLCGSIYLLIPRLLSLAKGLGAAC